MSDNMPLYLGMVGDISAFVAVVIMVLSLLYKLVIKKGFKKWMQIILSITIFMSVIGCFLLIIFTWLNDVNFVSKKDVAIFVSLSFCISFMSTILAMDIQDKAMLKLKKRIDDIEKALNTHSDTDHS